MQYPLGVPPNLRTNIDYIFILRENYLQNRRRIYEQYAGMFPNFDMFCTVMDQCTENYECLVIHNNAKSNKLEDQVFWYKAEAHDNFRIGKPSFWNYKKNKNKNNNIQVLNNSIPNYDPSIFANRKGPNVFVNKNEF